MKAAITGATGLIGRELTAELEKSGIDFICLSRTEQEDKKFFATDYSVESLAEILQGVDTVIHLAAIRGGNTSQGYAAYSANEVLTENILKAMTQAGVKKIIFLSSISIYSDVNTLPWSEEQKPEPINFYGLSKLTCEHLCFQYEKKGINPLVFRCTHVLGYEEKGYMLEIFMKNAYNKKILTVKGKSVAKREFIYVKDVAKALCFALSRPEMTGVFNLGTGESLTNLEVAEKINAVFNNDGNIEYLSELSEGIQSSYMTSKKLTDYGFIPEYSFSSGVEDICKEKFSNK